MAIKHWMPLPAALVLAACVTINVYFPEAAAQKAADQFIGSVLDGSAPKAPPAADKSPPAQDTPPPAHQPAAMLLDLLIPAAQAADVPNLRVQTPATQAIHGSWNDATDGS